MEEVGDVGLTEIELCSQEFTGERPSLHAPVGYHPKILMQTLEGHKKMRDASLASRPMIYANKRFSSQR